MRKLSRLILISIVLLLAALLWSSASQAAFKAAPDRIVAKAQQPSPPPRGTVAKRAWIICHTWKGVRCRYVLNVAWCEDSGFWPGKLGPNDEYGNPRVGLWQFGTHERSTFGYGSNAWTQAAAGYRYFLYAKARNWRHGWGPWECLPQKPWRPR